MEEEATFWKKCSSCKKPIPFTARYQVCSVSTCNSKKLGLAFCSVSCWDAHLGFANHREASAIEERSPTRDQFLSENEKKETPMTEPTPKKTFIRSDSPAATLPETDVLVVVSKVKKLIRDASEFNTSECAIEALTKIVVRESLKAIESAKASGRKTVMGRDF